MIAFLFPTRTFKLYHFNHFVPQSRERESEREINLKGDT